MLFYYIYNFNKYFKCIYVMLVYKFFKENYIFFYVFKFDKFLVWYLV